MSETKIQVGDFFVRSWGYDQTNVNFYRVVGLTPSGKSVRLQEVTQVTYDDLHVVPGERALQVTKRDAEGNVVYNDYGRALTVDAPIVTKRLRGEWVSWNSYSAAQLWNGHPQYQTPSGFGH